MKQVLMVIVFLVSCTVLQAQFNDSTFYMVRYVTTGIINRTNETSNYAITNGLRFSVNKKKLSFNSNSNWIYGQQRRELTNNDFTTALDVNWYPRSKKLYYWGLTTYESSYSLKVNNRTQMGVGLAFSPVDTTDFFINVSNGILYEFADLKITDSTNDVYSTFRNSFRLRLRYVFNNRITLDHVSYLQNSLQEKSDYIINSSTSVSVKIIKWISFTSALKYNKVNRNNRDNLLITFGITAEKFF